MKLINLTSQIFLVECNTAKELGGTFVRMQEFYESPNTRFRGKYFSFNEFRGWYCQTQSQTGKWTYGKDFGGYNVPGESLVKFYKRFFGRPGAPNAKESQVLNWVIPTALKKKCYLIGIIQGDEETLFHELHHAFYYLYPEYKKQVLKVLGLQRIKDNNLEKYVTYSGIIDCLKKNMYCSEVFKDEIAAYLMFGQDVLRLEGIDTRKYTRTAKELRNIFNKCRREVLCLKPQREQTKKEKNSFVR